MPEQDPLFHSPQAKRHHDFLGIFPERVIPTGKIHVLERNGRLLFVKSYAYKKEVPKSQDRIWRMLSKLGESDDAQGSITVACVWGIGVAQRDVIIYDHKGKSDMRTQTPQEFRLWLRHWWEGKL